MKKKTCYVVEDNEKDRETLLSYIQKTSFLSLSGTSANYSDAVNFLLTNKVDILYLDVNLSGNDNLTGMDIVKTVPRLPTLIFVSNHSEYAIDSYNLGKSIDFLLKPFNYERFLIATNRAISTVPPASGSNEGAFVFFKIGRKFQKVLLNEVLYFESFGIYVKVCSDLAKQPEVINETISSITKYLDNNFIRIHKQYIVNINKITGFDSNNIFVNGKPLPIGISYKTKLESLFKVLMNFDEDLS